MNKPLKALPILMVFGALAAGFAARPHDPFVLRAVLRTKPRMVLFALNTGLSVAYDGVGCDLYEAWAGGVQDGNKTYTHQSGGNHGATYYAQGNIVYKQAPGGQVSETEPSDTRQLSMSIPNEAMVTVWSATQGSTPVTVTPVFGGYTVDNTAQTATLHYSLTVGTAKTAVSELPDYTAGTGGLNLQRDFTFTGIPAGTAISLLLTGDGVKKADGTVVQETWVATGTGRIETRSGKVYFVQDKDGQSRLTGTWR